MKVNFNKKIKETYDKVYDQGRESFFSRFAGGKDISDTDRIVFESIDWTNKKVIDIGCGVGNTAAGLAALGAKSVLGVDYSKNAIKIAKKSHSYDNLEFKVDTLEGVGNSNDKFDVVMSLGTLEHMDDPKQALMKMLRMVYKEGYVIIVCPYFINARGFVWMTLQLLLNVPMSLTDKHFISSFDIHKWLNGTDFELFKTTCFDYDRANGDLMLVDMDKRLKNALYDAGLSNNNVQQLINWLENVVQSEHDDLTCMGGSNALYIIKRRG